LGKPSSTTSPASDAQKVVMELTSLRRAISRDDKEARPCQMKRRVKSVVAHAATHDFAGHDVMTQGGMSLTHHIIRSPVIKLLSPLNL
jgi:hypothetical protein